MNKNGPFSSYPNLYISLSFQYIDYQINKRKIFKINTKNNNMTDISIGSLTSSSSTVQVDFLQLMGQGNIITTDSSSGSSDPSTSTATITMPLLLLPVNNLSTDHCPITFEPIGSNTYYPPPPFQHNESNPCLLLTNPKYSHLLCMELMNCKHRFDARALVSHFLHNGLICPLCRQGNANTVFDVSATFKGFEVSDWVIEHQDLRAPKRRRVMMADLMAAIFLFETLENSIGPFRVTIPTPDDEPTTSTTTDGNHNVHVRFTFKDNNISLKFYGYSIYIILPYHLKVTERGYQIQIQL